LRWLTNIFLLQFLPSYERSVQGMNVHAREERSKSADTFLSTSTERSVQWMNVHAREERSKSADTFLSTSTERSMQGMNAHAIASALDISHLCMRMHTPPTT